MNTVKYFDPHSNRTGIDIYSNITENICHIYVYRVEKKKPISIRIKQINASNSALGKFHAQHFFFKTASFTFFLQILFVLYSARHQFLSYFSPLFFTSLSNDRISNNITCIPYTLAKPPSRCWVYI